MNLNDKILSRGSSVFEDDMNIITSDTNIPFDKLEGKTVFVTGATGLIGFNIISALQHYNLSKMNPIHIIALVRNIKKAKEIYDNKMKNLEIIVSDISDIFEVDSSIDYIIHGASITSSKDFVDYPVDTIMTAIEGTKNILEIAKKKNVKGFIYLSSMEVYGSPNTEKKISETSGTNLDTMQVRTSYPESKRMCETLCCAYGNQYNVPIFVLRLTQTIGPGVQYKDERVFAQFAKSVIEDKDIILHTEGKTKRSYIYTADAVRGILTVLLKGKKLNAYNVANESTYCSIFEMASLVAGKYNNGKNTVKIEIVGDNQAFGYAPELKMNLSTNKLQKIGWFPYYSLDNMYDRMILMLNKS